MKHDLENEVNKKIKSYNATTGFELTTRDITPEHLATGLCGQLVIAVERCNISLRILGTRPLRLLIQAHA